MSDEPSPLRLKPRSSSTSDIPPVAALAPPSDIVPPLPLPGEVVSEPVDGARFRLRPRPVLAVEPPAASTDLFAASLPMPPGAAAIQLPVPLMPDVGPPPPPPPSKASATSAPFALPLVTRSTPPPVTSADMQPKLRTQPPFPSGATPAGDPPKPVSIHIRGPIAGGDAPLATATPAPSASAPPSKKKSRRVLITAMLALLVLAGAFYGYQQFVSPSASVPLQPIAKKPVPAAVASTAAAETDIVPARVSPLAVPSGPSTPPPEPAPVASKPKPAVVTTDTAIAPDVTMSVPDEGATMAASAAFRTFVAGIKVSGVVASEPSRAVLNGRLVRVGQPLDDGLGLGIIFIGVDNDRHVLMFKERSGAIVTRRY